MKHKRLIGSLFAGAIAVCAFAGGILGQVKAAAALDVVVESVLRSDTEATAKYIVGEGIVGTTTGTGDRHVGTTAIPFKAGSEVELFFSVPYYKAEDVFENGLWVQWDEAGTTVTAVAEPQLAYDVWSPDPNRYGRDFRLDICNQNGLGRAVSMTMRPNQTQLDWTGMNCYLSNVTLGGWTPSPEISGQDVYRMVGAPTEETVYGIKFSKTAENYGHISFWDSSTNTWVVPASFAGHSVVGDFCAESTELYFDFVQWLNAGDPAFKVIVRELNGVDYTYDPNEDASKTPVIVKGDYELYHWLGGEFTLPAFSATVGETPLTVSTTAYGPDGGEVEIADGKIALDAIGKYEVVFSVQPLVEGAFEAGAYDQRIAFYCLDENKKFDATLDDLEFLYYAWHDGDEVWDENGFTTTDYAHSDKARGSSLGYDYDCSTDEIHTLTFSIPIYDSEGNLLENACNRETYGVDYPDIAIRDSDNHDKGIRIRMTDVYTEEGEVVLNVVYDWSTAPYWKDRYVSVKMAGKFTADSSFTIGVSGKVNEHITVLTSNGTMQPVGSPDGTAGDQDACAVINKFFEGTKSVEIHFVGYWAGVAHEGVDETNCFTVTYKDLDGQPMMTFGGKPVDIKAPVVGATVLPGKVSQFKTGTAYVFDVEIVSEVFEELEQRCLVYRKKGDTEWISTGVYDLTSGKIKDCRFALGGVLEVAVKAVDTAGNVGIGKITEIEIAKDYEIIVSGTVPTEGKTGEKITLPTATATDKNNVERTVVISVENVYGKSIEMDDATSFTPSEAGMYYVIYRSSYEEAGKTVSVKREFTITVTQGAAKKEEKAGGCSSVAFATTALTLVGAAFLTLKKKENN